MSRPRETFVWLCSISARVSCEVTAASSAWSQSVLEEMCQKGSIFPCGPWNGRTSSHSPRPLKPWSFRMSRCVSSLSSAGCETLHVLLGTGLAARWHVADAMAIPTDHPLTNSWNSASKGVFRGGSNPSPIRITTRIDNTPHTHTFSHLHKTTKKTPNKHESSEHNRNRV